MNAPGSPSSPLQMTYFTSPRLPGPLATCTPVGKPAPPRPRRPAGLNRVDHLLGSKAFRRTCAGPGNHRRGTYSSRSVGSIWPHDSVARCTCGPRNAADRMLARVDVPLRPTSPNSVVGSRSSHWPAASPRRCPQALGLEVPQQDVATRRRAHADVERRGGGRFFADGLRAGSCGRGTISSSGVWWHMPTQPTRLTSGWNSGLGQQAHRPGRAPCPLPARCSRSPGRCEFRPPRHWAVRPPRLGGRIRPVSFRARKSPITPGTMLRRRGGRRSAGRSAPPGPACSSPGRRPAGW